jgi:hypothetical protein
MKFGKWTIEDNVINKRHALAVCDCGTQKVVPVYNLKSGKSISCGCSKNPIKPGDIFGNWTAVEPISKLMYLVRCHCGTVTTRQRSALKSGNTLSCGCGRLRPIAIGENNGFLTVTSDQFNKEGRVYINVKCVCGKEYDIIKESFSISRSCGCKKQELREETTLKKYGVRHTAQIPGVREKAKATCMERYGYESFSLTPKAREKMSNHLLNVTVKNKSRAEQELKDWIFDSFGLKSDKIRISDKGVTREIDIYIPDLNIGIEYNGLFFHHSENGGLYKGKSPSYHKEKTDMLLKARGAELVHIWDAEWTNKKDQVKAFLSGKLQRGASIRASACEIKELSSKDASAFCEQYHLQGGSRSSFLNIGLFYKNELMSVMSFSKPHRQNMDALPNLSRYAIKPGYRIHGGLSKMSKHVFNKIGSFITFVHKRLSNGNSYEKSGYTKMSESAPDYFYYDKAQGKIISKQSRKKGVVKTPSGMTEHEHALMDGLLRVYDCGKIKFLFDMLK